MAYASHRSDLITAAHGYRGALTLYREISGQRWTRKVAPDECLTPMEAAVAVGVHRVTMYDWIEKGLVPAYQGEDGALLVWGEVYQFARARGLVE